MRARVLFYGGLTAACITAAPLFCLAWLVVLGTVNWHDCLQVTVAAAVLYHLHTARRERRAADRAADRAERAAADARRAARATWAAPPRTAWEDTYATAEGMAA